MKTDYKTIFRSLILFVLFIMAGCQGKSEASEEALNIIARRVLENNGTVITLEIKDSDLLFKSNQSSIIGKDNPDLAYIGMTYKGNPQGGPQQEGSTSGDINAKDFVSDVYVGKSVVWKISPPATSDYRLAFQEIDFDEGNYENNGNQCNAFNVRRALPDNSPAYLGAVPTEVINDETLVGCKQSYSIIFFIEHKRSRAKRYFVLDPWIFVNR